MNGQYELADLAHSLELGLRPDESLAARADLNGRDDGDGDGDETLAFSSVMVKGRRLTADKKMLHVYPMSQIKHLGAMDSVGLVVISGPVSRVTGVMALDDLGTSSGWPILGVVGVPRARRGWLKRMGR